MSADSNTGGLMSASKIVPFLLLGFALIWLILAIRSLFGASVPAPAPGLLAWTDLIAKAVGVIVAARVIWSGAEVLRSYARR